MSAPVVAGIFVGGHGLRMGGVAKGLLRAPGGETIIERWGRILGALDIPSVLVGAHPAYATCGIERLDDAPHIAGPLGGLIALLEHARAGYAIAVACDMPYVSERALARLRDAPPASTVSARRDGRWEPFFARYEVAAVLETARARAATGMTALQGLMDACGAQELDVAPEDWAELRDWDTPGDLGSTGVFDVVIRTWQSKRRMKLRVRGNSLRLRLGKSEVTCLGHGERVEDAIAFGVSAADRLVYAVVSSDKAQTMVAHFAKNELLVTVPSQLAREWALGEGVGLEAAQPVGDGGTLAILVEKDFACLTPRTGEDDTDAYPNPTGC